MEFVKLELGTKLLAEQENAENVERFQKDKINDWNCDTCKMSLKKSVDNIEGNS